MLWLLSYVLSFILIRRSHTSGRRIAAFIALSYVGGGIVALYVLPHFTGAHYDYYDVAFETNGSLSFVPMDFRFVTNHIGLAVGTGCLLAKLIQSEYPSLSISLIGLMIPIVGEVVFRFGVWRSFLHQLSGYDPAKYSGSPSADAVAGMGPSISAGLFVFVSVAILVRRDSNRSRATVTNA